MILFLRKGCDDSRTAGVPIGLPVRGVQRRRIGPVRRDRRNEAGRWRQVNARADSVWAQRVNTPEPHLRWVRWTEREIAYALDRSRSLRYIARMLGRSASAVSAIRRKHRDTASNDA
ncbi:hypothetical protein DYE20_24670 [[Mycobacterium] chelonae subsp. gwanakae]|nr:hypothetical protein DYE20_24670 [[Mycobacterium] chelonae subsp. gwanakae]